MNSGQTERELTHVASADMVRAFCTVTPDSDNGAVAEEARSGQTTQCPGGH